MTLNDLIKTAAPQATQPTQAKPSAYPISDAYKKFDESAPFLKDKYDDALKSWGKEMEMSYGPKWQDMWGQERAQQAAKLNGQPMPQAAPPPPQKQQTVDYQGKFNEILQRNPWMSQQMGSMPGATPEELHNKAYQMEQDALAQKTYMQGGQQDWEGWQKQKQISDEYDRIAQNANQYQQWYNSPEQVVNRTQEDYQKAIQEGSQRAQAAQQERQKNAPDYIRKTINDVYFPDANSGWMTEEDWKDADEIFGRSYPNEYGPVRQSIVDALKQQATLSDKLGQHLSAWYQQKPTEKQLAALKAEAEKNYGLEPGTFDFYRTDVPYIPGDWTPPMDSAEVLRQDMYPIGNPQPAQTQQVVQPKPQQPTAQAPAPVSQPAATPVKPVQQPQGNKPGTTSMQPQGQQQTQKPAEPTNAVPPGFEKKDGAPAGGAPAGRPTGQNIGMMGWAKQNPTLAAGIAALLVGGLALAGSGGGGKRESSLGMLLALLLGGGTFLGAQKLLSVDDAGKAAGDAVNAAKASGQG